MNFKKVAFALLVCASLMSKGALQALTKDEFAALNHHDKWKEYDLKQVLLQKIQDENANLKNNSPKPSWVSFSQGFGTCVVLVLLVVGLAHSVTGSGNKMPGAYTSSRN